MSIVIYCSPRGNDRCTGQSPDPAAPSHAGPVRSLRAAFNRIRVARVALQHQGLAPETAVIELEDGNYPLVEPLIVDTAAASNVTVRAKNLRRAALSGGTTLSGLSRTTMRGKEVLVADVAMLEKHLGIIRQVFVGGSRRTPARTSEILLEGLSERHTLPNNQVYGVRLPEGAVAALSQPKSVEAIFPGLYSAHRISVAGYLADERILLLERPLSRNHIESEVHPAFLWLEHVLDRLEEPGTWCCDRQAGKLYYLPLPGESASSVELVVTTSGSLLKVAGTPEHPVENLWFEGVAFQYASWEPVHSTAQSDPFVPPTIELAFAKFSGFRDSSFEHFGHSGVKLGDGTKHCAIEGCRFFDIGGTAIVVNGQGIDAPRSHISEGHRIADNEIEALGRVFVASSAILVMNAARNLIAYNRISDLYYTAISVGWTWGYRPQVTMENRIEHNHIFNLGQGILSDLAGIYTLGVQPGTTIRHNLIHNVTRRAYGGFGINLDEGSSHLVIEHNLIYDISSQCLHQHFGRENAIRHNIFAYGAEGMIGLSRGNRMNWPEKGGYDDGSITSAFSFHHNVMLSKGQGMFIGALGDESGSVTLRDFECEQNLYWDETGAPFFGNGIHGTGGRESMTQILSFEEWQKLGRDETSQVVDPRFQDPAGGDFRMPEGNPLERFGKLFLGKVGPRTAEERAADRRPPELVARFAYG